QRSARHLSRRPVRAPGISRQRHRQGASRLPCEEVRRERLGAPAMVGARLERAVDRLLQIARRGVDGRVDGVPPQWTGPGGLCRAGAVTEIVLIVAVADNGVIGADGAIPSRLKSDQQRFKAITMGKPVVMGRKTFLSR